MKNIVTVEPYKASITAEILKKWNGTVRVWSEPKSAVDGARVVEEITKPTEVTVIEEQKDMYGSLTQRAKVKYGAGKEGWVLHQMIAKK